MLERCFNNWFEGLRDFSVGNVLTFQVWELEFELHKSVKKEERSGMVVYFCNPSVGKAETHRCPELIILAHRRVPGQRETETPYLKKSRQSRQYWEWHLRLLFGHHKHKHTHEQALSWIQPHMHSTHKLSSSFSPLLSSVSLLFLLLSLLSLSYIHIIYCSFLLECVHTRI